MTKKRLWLLGTSVAVASALFVARMLVYPPETQAGTSQGLDPEQMTLSASNGIPSFDDKYQRHMGVLDTLPKL